MKQNLFVMGLALAALSSCSQNEVLDVPESRTIQFDTYVGNPSRAASIVTNDNFKSFYVFGGYTDGAWTSKFDNVNVYKGSGTAWGYDNLVEAEAKTWEFAAYSDGGIEGKGFGQIATTGADIPTVSYTAATTDPTPAKLTITDYLAAKGKDLVVAFNHTPVDGQGTPGGTAGNNNVAQFNFRHALAQVKFTLQSALGNNEISIEEFKVEGFNDKATLTFTENGSTENDIMSWTTPNETRNLTQLDRSVATTDDPATGTYVIIPQKLDGNGTADIAVSFNAKLYSAPGTAESPKTATFTTTISNPDVLNFKPGFCYNFIATIDGNDMGVISFGEPVVTPWEDATPDYDINN